MLNKKLIVYDEKNPGQDYTIVTSLKQFRTLAQTGSRQPLVFSDRLLSLKEKPWKALMDDYLYLRAVAYPEPLSKPEPMIDFVNREDLSHYDLKSVTVQKSEGVFPQPKYSIVIPFRDRDDTLPLVIDAMNRIETSHAFEIVLVNDGSREPVPAKFIKQLNELNRAWTLASLPPSKYFRAGFARNVGALNAQGEVLVFIDSDILLPADFFQDLDQQLQEGEVIQAKRWQIWRNKRPQMGQSFKGALEEPNLFWNEFQNSPVPWMQSEQPWRWASTFCLAVERSKFFELGGFRLWYSTYGFEDTDFGLRAHRAGLRLKRSNANVFHLSPHGLEGWKRDSRRARDNRLRLSARKYFLANHATESLTWLTHLML